MEIKRIDDQVAVAAQVAAPDMSAIAAAGYRSVICNRPDAEAPDQPSHVELQRAAEAAGLRFQFQPVTSGKVTDQDAEVFGKIVRELPGPVLAFCRTGTRCTTLWALHAARSQSLPQVLAQAKAAGYDMNPVARRIANRGRTAQDAPDAEYQLVIVGGGAAGISVAASILQRAPNVTIAIIEPADVHYYQPGWTMVGGGIFEASETVHTMARIIPD
jgi:sulfide:quinone oxidoreductase